MRHAFTVPGKIAGKGRPRWHGGGRPHTPPETVKAEQWVRLCALQAGVTLIEGPVSLDLTAMCAIPTSWSKRKRAEALAGAAWAVRKPDIDNVAKLVGDALNGIAWADDAQIARITGERRWACDGQERLVVIIKPAGDA